MLNVHELERQWMRYKIRKYLPAAIAGITLIAVSVTALIFFPHLTNDDMPQVTREGNTAESSDMPPEKQPVATQPIQQSALVVSRPQAPAVSTPSQQTPIEQLTVSAQPVMKPSMQFMRDLEEEAMTYYETERVPDQYAIVEQPQRRSEPANAPSVAYTSNSSDMKIALEEQGEPKPEISITQENSDDLKDVIKRFKTNKNPALSLFIARKYYDMGNYKAAYDYALRTNEINSDIEDSWLIFAKSLVKLGHKDQAIKTLATYANHSHSVQAKELLDKIRKGHFQ
jgi:hypothetical protein